LIFSYTYTIIFTYINIRILTLIFCSNKNLSPEWVSS
jgi:hypothetical protein